MTAEPIELLRLRHDATATRAADGRLVLAERGNKMTLAAQAPGVAAAFASLSKGAEESALAALALADGEPSLARLRTLLTRLERNGWIERELRGADGVRLATIQPIGHRSPPRPLEAAGIVVLSRFAVLLAGGGTLRLQTPRSPLIVAIHAPAVAALLACIARPGTAEELALRSPGLARADASAVLGLLVRARAVVAAGEEDEGALAHWSTADMLFHARSRVGGHVGGYGGTYRLRGRIEPLPAVKPVSDGGVALPRPDLESLARDDVPFTRVVEQRRSSRTHDDAHPIDVTALGHFLYRCARVRAVFSDGRQEVSSRPYPGGGAIYELELYPAVHRCAGVDPGLYRYDPQGHTLGVVAHPGRKVTLLLDDARRSAGMAATPQVLITVAARFARAMWKYESMAYALVLKDVGVLYQTMYLVATAMGLSACALGGGSSEAFSDAAELDPLVESSVGEFLLGSASRIGRRPPPIAVRNGDPRQ